MKLCNVECTLGSNDLNLKLVLWLMAASDSSPRFATDPDRVATEKLSMTAVPKAFLDSEYKELPAVIGSG